MLRMPIILSLKVISSFNWLRDLLCLITWSFMFLYFQGACGGELACSTCHLIFDQNVYDTLPPKSDEEEDMLDLAFELTET